MKSYVILGNNKDTPGLVNHLRGKDNGMITIVDEEQKYSVAKRDDLLYVNGTIDLDIKDMGVPVVYYHYIDPMDRRGTRKWISSLKSEL